jgi:RimJ/RimL family protein N-acetyltransferase
LEPELEQLGPKSMGVPDIETNRLILRAHRLDDFPALAAMWGDPAVARFIGGRPLTRKECWARLLRYAGHWELLGFGFWAVQWKDDARLIGDVGFANWERDISPSLDGLPEAGWVFSTEAHGRGIATEAVNAALTWMHEHVDVKPTVCIIGPENAASIRLAQKVGYQEHCRSVFRGSEVIQFRRKGALDASGGADIMGDW